jgi:radical SAM protein with 4Fe4S-binding SPASM domain
MHPELLNIKWVLTDRCNFNCDFCYNSSGPQASPGLRTKEIFQIQDQINESPVKHISLIGGEPLLRKDFSEIVSRFRPDITLGLDTNGTLLLSKWKDWFVDRFHYVAVGLDGPPEVNERFRHNTIEVVKAIRFLQEEGVTVKVPVIVNKKNYADLGRMVRFLYDLGVNYIQLNKYNPVYGADNNSLILSPQEENIALGQAFRLIDSGMKNKIGFNGWYNPTLFEKIPRKAFPSCCCGYYHASISAEGDFVPCFILTQKHYFDLLKIFYPIPNLKIDSLLEAFEKSPLFRDIRTATVNFTPETCLSCIFKDLCTHGCRVYAFLTTGSLYDHFSLCRVSSDGRL